MLCECRPFVAPACKKPHGTGPWGFGNDGLIHAAHIGVSGSSRSGGLRRRGRHIPRPAAGGRARSFCRSSSPRQDAVVLPGAPWDKPSPPVKKPTARGRGLCKRYFYQYMPPMSGAVGAAGAGGSGLSVTRLSVVSSTPATEAAFSRAERVTLVGSTMPAEIMSQ